MPTLFLHFFLYLFTTTVTNLIPAVHSNCIEAQKQSLLHFKKSVTFYSSFSSKLITWNSSTDCCSWLGVTCSTNGRVVGLDLSGEYFSCNIDNSSSLFQLQHLQSLNLTKNDFNGSTIPSAIGKLANLRYLNLSKANFSGQIPIEVARLTRLVTLDLSRNGYHMSRRLLLYAPVIASFSNLRSLDFSNLLGTFPKEIFQMPSLQTIDLSGNFALHVSFPEFPNNGSLRSLTVDGTSFSGDLPNSIGNLKMLSSIRLSDCNITGSVPKSIENLTQLAHLNMSGNRFNSPISSIHWETLVNLELLDLSNNQLYGTIPSSVVSLPKLKTLTLSHNRFSGQVPEFSNTSSPLIDTLYLENNNLEGQIPTSIFNLQGLQYLNLSSNNFSSFPFCGPQQLRNLWSVDLSHNNLLFDYNCTTSSFLQIENLVFASTKLRAFPDFLRNQSTLHSLDLSNNQIQGEIPNWILSLESLTSLDLSGNSLVTLEAPLPHSTSTLSSLDLNSNKLQGIHSSYSFLQLRSLSLASNKLTTFPDFLRNQSYLTNLDLSDNHIQGQIPNWIWIFDSLQVLNLSCNSLESLEAPLLNSTYVLWSIDLHSNQLQGHFPLFLSGDYMDYSRNNFNSVIPVDIGDFISTKSYLSLSSNNFHGAIPKSICNASGVVLDLSNNSLSGNIPQCLTQLPQLSVIDLKRNNLSGTIPDNFPNICGLQTLDLSNNQIQGKFPKSLVNCSKLEVLNIGNNNIADTFPCFLMSLSTLRILVLRSNKFYGNIGCHKTSGTWPVLQIIDLAHNNFSGDMPGRMSLTWQAMASHEDDSPTELGFSYYSPCSQYNRGCYLDSVYYKDAITAIIKGLELDVVKILTIFTLIDYSSNKFNGSIPEEIGELKSLYVLNLSDNAFTGKIPSSFGKMRQLESLDLSKNHLSGQIPPEFANLNFLSHLNVSYNQLTGRIPTNTQFSTFPSTSFEGNKGLWGPPLTSDTAIVLPPPKFNGSSSNPNSGDEIDWNVISAEIGFTCGFGIAVGSLLFCKRWKKWYYRAMFKILFKIFPQLEHRFGNHRRHVYINQRYWRR